MVTAMPDSRDYQRLDAEAVKTTVDRLTTRIRTRFPERNLSEVSESLSGAIDDLLIRPQVRWAAGLRYASRVLVFALIGILFIAVAVMTGQATKAQQPESVWEWVQIAESMINDIVFVGIAVFFLWQLPLRWERARDLTALHRLRSLAHVIDMHQLTQGSRPTPIRFPQDARDRGTQSDGRGTEQLSGNTARRCSRSSERLLLSLRSTRRTIRCCRRSTALKT